MSIIDTYVHSDDTEYEIADSATRSRVSAIEGKIPSGASPSNKMATASDVAGLQDNIIANTKLIKDTVGWSRKNKLPNTYTSQTKNGVTFTVNQDGSVTVNGTATTNTNLVLMRDVTEKLGNGNTIIINGCPSGGSWQTYCIYIDQTGASADRGSGATLTLNGEGDQTCNLFIASGQTVNNLVFKPMIRDASILDDTYEPYFGSTAFPRSEQAVMGAKNIMPIYLSDLKASLTTGWNWNGNTVSKDGITFTLTVKSNFVSTIALSGTSTAQVDFNTTFTVEKTGMYKVNGGIPEAYGQLHLFDVNESSRPYTDATKTVVQYDVSHGEDDVTYYLESGHTIMCTMRVFSGKTPTDKVFKPMLRLASDTDPTYAPFAMTNKQLTEKVAANVVDIKTDFKTALMSATGSTVTDVETALLSTYGDLMILNSRINKAANTGINCNVSVPYSVLPKTRGTVYVGLNSPMGAGTASLGGGSLALRYTNSDGATYVDLTVFALMDKS